jgi:cytochrome c oxidase cbb3-type subunit III
MRIEQKERRAAQQASCHEARERGWVFWRIRCKSNRQPGGDYRFEDLSNRLRNVAGYLCCLGLAFAGALHAQQNPPVNGRAGDPSAGLFGSNCAVCHGSDGRGGERAPNIATEHEVVNLSDVQLTGILNKGVLASGMPAFGYLGEEKIKQLVEYLRELQGVAGSGQAQLPGDPAEGEKIFFADGNCSRCHMIDGRGGFLGEDLSAYARGRLADAIRAAILHPGDSPGGGGHMVDIQTADGNSYRGLIRARDNFNVVLQGEDGAYHSISRDRIRQMAVDSQSLMPQDYGTKLDEMRINDLISYLLKSSGAGKPAPPKNGEED